MSGLLRGLRSNLGALEERNFRLLWLGQTGSTIGDGAVEPAPQTAPVLLDQP